MPNALAATLSTPPPRSPHTEMSHLGDHDLCARLGGTRGSVAGRMYQRSTEVAQAGWWDPGGGAQDGRQLGSKRQQEVGTRAGQATKPGACSVSHGTSLKNTKPKIKLRISGDIYREFTEAQCPLQGTVSATMSPTSHPQSSPQDTHPEGPDSALSPLRWSFSFLPSIFPPMVPASAGSSPLGNGRRSTGMGVRGSGYKSCWLRTCCAILGKLLYLSRSQF